jgi:hypothetical protein
MALALVLGKAKTPPRRLAVEATVTLDDVGGTPTIVSSVLNVRGWVTRTDAAGFQKSVDEAAALCPISRLFAAAHITIEALPGTEVRRPDWQRPDGVGTEPPGEWRIIGAVSRPRSGIVRASSRRVRRARRLAG